MIEIRIDDKRGCGYRKEGGLYLILPEFEAKPCGKLPFPLNKCPTCSQGIKFCRGWTWINGEKLFGKGRCDKDKNLPLNKDCYFCILSNPPEKMGLLWIGKKFYKTPEDWIKESKEIGISRRIKTIPRGFKIGETWVCVAHIEGILGDLPGPGIFQVFKPSAVEYVVKLDDPEEKLEDLQKRGITPVKVVQRQMEFCLKSKEQ